MAEEAAAGAPTGQPKAKSSTAMLAMIVAVSGILGVVAATLLVGPKLVANRTTEQVESGAAEHGASTAESGGHGPANTSSGHGGSEESGDFIELGNILVNPAGSHGLRFLMTSVSFEVYDANELTRLRRREAQLRDIVIGTVEQYSLEDLSAPGIRDRVKAQLSHAVDSALGTPVRVFIPQFVIN